MLAKNIGEYLKEHDIKKSWLANRLDVPVTTLTRIINGYEEMQADMFINICMILSVPPETFVNA